MWGNLAVPSCNSGGTSKPMHVGRGIKSKERRRKEKKNERKVERKKKRRKKKTKKERRKKGGRERAREKVPTEMLNWNGRETGIPPSHGF